VLWNARAPELWRYTLTYLDRELARALGVSTAGLNRIARREFAKVAEYQARGLIHFHAILRLDAATPPGQPKQYTPPPPQLDAGLLEFALRAAAGKAAVPVPDPDDPTVTCLVRWGDQLDIRPITAGSGAKVTPEQVAGYVAKYATKHTEALGPGLHHRRTTRTSRACRAAGCAPTSPASSRPPGPSAPAPTSTPCGCAPGRTSSASAATGPPARAPTPPP
jgi:hypothetical protein